MLDDDEDDLEDYDDDDGGGGYEDKEDEEDDEWQDLEVTEMLPGTAAASTAAAGVNQIVLHRESCPQHASNLLDPQSLLLMEEEEEEEEATAVPSKPGRKESKGRSVTIQEEEEEESRMSQVCVR